MILGAASSVLLPHPPVLWVDSAELSFPVGVNTVVFALPSKSFFWRKKKCVFKEFRHPQREGVAHWVLLRGCSLMCGRFFHAAFLLLEAWLGGQVSSVNADSLTVPSASSTDGSGVAALLSQPRGAQEAPVPAQPLCCAVQQLQRPPHPPASAACTEMCRAVPGKPSRAGRAKK